MNPRIVGRSDMAESGKPSTCLHCGQPFKYGVNVFTQEGMKEIAISGMCEFCFDGLFDEDGDVQQDDISGGKMKSQHTPGPWEARSRSASDVSLVVMDATFTEVCQVVPKAMRQYGQNDDTDQANAALIASAPDLLSALEALTRMLKPYMGQGRMDDQINAALEAIARARG